MHIDRGEWGASIRIRAIALAASAICATQARAASWTTPVEPPAGCASTPGAPPSLAVNAAGAWVIAGYAQTGTGLEAFSVEVCTSTDGVTWSGPVTIGQGTSPAVAMLPDGRIVAIWQGGPSTSPNVQASTRTPAGSWSAPVVVSTVPGHPLIGLDGSGNAAAVWAGTTLAGAVATASLPAGGSWSAPTILTSAGGAVGLATDAAGQVVVGWRTHAGAIQAVSGGVLSGLGTPVTVGATYGAIHPIQVALGDDGVASLAWTANDGNRIVTRSPAGTWSGVTLLSGTSSAGIGTAVDGRGNIVAAFAKLTQTGTLTYVVMQPAGGTWQPATLLSALDDKGSPGVASDAAGTFVVIWTDSAGSVEAVTIPPGGGLSSGVVVGTGPTRRLLVIPGKAILWTAAGISEQTVN
jgi:hypothetical protein